MQPLTEHGFRVYRKDFNTTTSCSSLVPSLIADGGHSDGVYIAPKIAKRVGVCNQQGSTYTCKVGPTMTVLSFVSSGELHNAKRSPTKRSPATESWRHSRTATFEIGLNKSLSYLVPLTWRFTVNNVNSSHLAVSSQLSRLQFIHRVLAIHLRDCLPLWPM